MPEMPEVETVKRILEPQLEGRRIVGLTLNRPDVIAHPLPEAFIHAAAGCVIQGMGRRGKYLTLYLDGGKRIMLHLRMTGRLLVAPPELEPEKHTHIIFHLDDGRELRYADARRFGRFWMFLEGEEDCCSGAQKLGAEPFSEAFGAGYLKQCMGKRRKAVKECLLDQSMVAGIGNIYGDEILFAAGLYPGRPAAGLKDPEWEALAAAVPAVLLKGIEDNTMTPQEYLAGRGREYRNLHYRQVYGHEGEPCPRCGRAVERIVLGGRSSYYCPGCQVRD